MNSIKTKVTLLILVILMISNALIGITTLTEAKNAVESGVKDNVKLSAVSIAEKIEAENNTKFDLLRKVATMPFLKSHDYDIYQKNAMLSEISGLGGIAYFDEKGSCLIGGNYVNFVETEPYIREGLANREYVSPPRASGEDTLLFYEVPVLDDNGKNNGLLVIVGSGSIMCDYVSKITVGKDSHPVIVDRESAVIVGDISMERVLESMTEEYKPPIDESYGKLSVIYKDLLAGGSQFSNYVDPNTGIAMTSYHCPVGESCSWSIYCAAPTSDYMSILDSMQQKIFFIVSGCMILSMIVSICLISKFLKPLKTIQTSISDIAEGNADLTKRITLSEKGEIGGVVKGFNKFSKKLHEIILQLKASKDELSTAGEDLEASTQDTSTSISEIIGNIKEINEHINNQSESVAETAGAVNEIASNIESLERMIENQSSGVSEASSAVEQMIGNIKSVTDSVDKMAYSFGELSSSAKTGSELQLNVNDKIELIKNQSEALQEANSAIAAIAEQTNLLAMNAAIEAAHAGEAGKGFSVVAEEIRKLSETSSEQSKTIGEELNNIGESIISVVSASEQSSQAFMTVSTKIKETDEIVRQIKCSMEEQNAGSKQISDALLSMNDSTMEVRTASKEMAQGNKQILAEVQKLQSATGEMKNRMELMNHGAIKINETGIALTEISSKLKGSISAIGEQIDQFKV